MAKKVKKKKVIKVKKVTKPKTKKVKKVVIKKTKKVLKKIRNKSPKLKKVPKTTGTHPTFFLRNLRGMHLTCSVPKPIGNVSKTHGYA